MYENETMLALHPRHPNVDFYIKHLPQEHRHALHTLREQFHQWVPHLRESMQYRMPTFVTSAIICATGSLKNRMSLFICHTEILDRYRESLKHLTVRRTTVYFQELAQLPMDAVEAMVRESDEFLQRWLGPGAPSS